jgi:hypothetical protein
MQSEHIEDAAIHSIADFSQHISHIVRMHSTPDAHVYILRVGSLSDTNCICALSVACFRSSVESAGTVTYWGICGIHDSPASIHGAAIFLTNGSAFVLELLYASIAPGQELVYTVGVRWYPSADSPDVMALGPVLMCRYTVGEYSIQVAEIVRMGQLVQGYGYHATVNAENASVVLELSCIRAKVGNINVDAWCLFGDSQYHARGALIVLSDGSCFILRVESNTAAEEHGGRNLYVLSLHRFDEQPSDAEISNMLGTYMLRWWHRQHSNTIRHIENMLLEGGQGHRRMHRRRAPRWLIDMVSTSPSRGGMRSSICAKCGKNISYQYSFEP